MPAALGHLAVSYGGHRAHIVAVDRILAASGGLEPDESVSVDKRNLYHTFAVDGIGGGRRMRVSPWQLQTFAEFR